MSASVADAKRDGWNDIAITCQDYAGLISYLAVHDQISPAVTASALPYGSGCGAPAFGLIPDANGRPLLGQTASATVTSVPSALCGVMLGFSDTNLGGTPLPLSLSAIGMPGCDLLQSAELLLPTAPLGATTRSFTLAIPAMNALLGANVFLQAHAVAPGQNALGFTTSNGVRWVLGNR